MADELRIDKTMWWHPLARLRPLLDEVLDTDGQRALGKRTMDTCGGEQEKQLA